MPTSMEGVRRERRVKDGSWFLLYSTWVDGGTIFEIKDTKEELNLKEI